MVEVPSESGDAFRDAAPAPQRRLYFGCAAGPFAEALVQTTGLPPPPYQGCAVKGGPCGSHAIVTQDAARRVPASRPFALHQNRRGHTARGPIRSPRVPYRARQGVGGALGNSKTARLRVMTALTAWCDVTIRGGRGASSRGHGRRGDGRCQPVCPSALVRRARGRRLDLALACIKTTTRPSSRGVFFSHQASLYFHFQHYHSVFRLSRPPFHSSDIASFFSSLARLILPFTSRPLSPSNQPTPPTCASPPSTPLPSWAPPP